MKYLLDTSVVSSPALVRPNPRIVHALRAHSGVCAIPALVWHELRFGCERMPRGRKRERLADYLREVVRAVYPILPYDQAAADWHAAERARLEQAGRSPPFVDGQIASIAATAGLVLVTENTKDFSAFHGLTIDDWS